jgi:hypothetical protein
MFLVKNEEKVDSGQMSAYRLLALERLDLVLPSQSCSKKVKLVQITKVQTKSV